MECVLVKKLMEMWLLMMNKVMDRAWWNYDITLILLLQVHISDLVGTPWFANFLKLHIICFAQNDKFFRESCLMLGSN